jgi:GrpB-like predicted nucleotidyltransferase (UPF0157 family)
MKRDASPVEIRDYDPAWPLHFSELATKILSALSGSALRAEHVGSTAVTGLAGKPVIDIDLKYPDVKHSAARLGSGDIIFTLSSPDQMSSLGI